MPEHSAADLFFHVRVIIGIVTGLSVARLLTGIARFVQHPVRERIYWIHLGWVGYLLLAVIHFWWFEFGLSRIEVWRFEVYFFVLFYAALFFFTCSILFPDRMDEYSGFADYFHSRQKWFYGLLASLFVCDILDTAVKGSAHLHALGTGYLIRQAALFALAVIAIFVRSPRYHGAFVVIAIVAEVMWILLQFAVLS